MGFIDAHLHLQDPRISPNLQSIVSDARRSGVSQWMVNGTSPDDWANVRAIARKNPEAIAGYGLHPWRVNEFGLEGIEALESYLAAEPSAFVGEIGLDKWVHDHDIVLQKKCFIEQLSIANRHGRSTAVHCLQAWGHLLECMKDVPPEEPFLLHSYGGPCEMVDDFLELGGFFSISGYFFRPEKAEKLAVFDGIPKGRILLETDAPDMLPPDCLIAFPLSDNLNHPANLARIYEAYADHVSLPVNTIVEQVTDNFSRWYQAKTRSSADDKSPIE